MRKWNYKVNISGSLRKAIRDELDVYDEVISICQEVQKKCKYEYVNVDFEDLQLEIEVAQMDNELEDEEYYLEELYDLCDRHDIWICL